MYRLCTVWRGWQQHAMCALRRVALIVSCTSAESCDASMFTASQSGNTLLHECAIRGCNKSIKASPLIVIAESRACHCCCVSAPGRYAARRRDVAPTRLWLQFIVGAGVDPTVLNKVQPAVAAPTDLHMCRLRRVHATLPTTTAATARVSGRQRNF